jgi:hypothetical protein
MVLDKAIEIIFSRKEKMDALEVMMLINKLMMEEDEVLYFALDTEIMNEEENITQKENWDQVMRMHNFYMNVCQ